MLLPKVMKKDPKKGKYHEWIWLNLVMYLISNFKFYKFWCWNLELSAGWVPLQWQDICSKDGRLVVCCLFESSIHPSIFSTRFYPWQRGGGWRLSQHEVCELTWQTIASLITQSNKIYQLCYILCLNLSTNMDLKPLGIPAFITVTILLRCPLLL